MGKRGSGLDYYYNPFLFGGGGNFSNQPAAQRQQQINRMIERNIAELAVNRFKWTNLPDEISQRFIEVSLLMNGQIVFYYDHDYDKLICAKASSSGYVNFMDEPTSFTVIGPGPATNDVMVQGIAFMPKQIGAYIPMVHKDKPEEFKRKRAISMWPNYFRFPEIDVIKIYASRLATTDTTLEINTKNARRNKMLASTQNTQLSVVNLARQIDEGVDGIQISGALDPSTIVSAIDLGIDPETFDKLHVLRTRWWNECMGLLGIDNANQDKKERLVQAEVGANDSQTDSMRYVSLNARREAVDRINDVFGTKIEVDFNVEVEAQAKQAQQIIAPDSQDGE